MIDLYGYTHRARPESLTWLARSQVRRLAERWRQDGFDGWCEERRASPLVRYLGPAALAAAMLVGVPITANVVATESSELVLLWLLCVGFAAVAGVHVCETVAAMTVRGWFRQEATADFHDDLRRYQRQLDFLRDRPSDMEMGTWLDYDLRHIRNRALAIYRLRPSDVLTHLALVEGMPGFARARVPLGPARYQRCLVTLYLLTENGVREFRTVLKVESGELGHQWRLGFPYDMVVSAAVAELDRSTGKQRRLILLDEALSDEFKLPPLEDPNINQEFVIALVNGFSAQLQIEDYKDLILPGEDRTKLFELALETSGVSYAMQIMEAVAVEGKDWILKEQARYRWGEF